MPDIELTTVPTDTPVLTDTLWWVDLSEAPDAINQSDWDAVRTMFFASGSIDGGALTSFEIPNSAAPTVNVDGEIALDTTVTDFSHGLIRFYGGEDQFIISVPTAVLTSPTNGYVLAYNSSLDEFGLVPSVSDGDKGDVVVSSSGNVWTIDNDVVTLAKLANAAANSKLVGSGVSGAGVNYVEITVGSGLVMTGTTLSATGDGAGDMLSSVYDPQSIAGDAFARANHTGIEHVAGEATTTGSQLITNGTFPSDASGWTLNASSSWSAGKIVVSADGVNYPTISTSITLAANTDYILTFDLSSVTESMYIYFDDISAGSDLYSTAGSKTFVFTSDFTGATNIYFESDDDGVGTGWSIDNVSLFATSSISPGLIVDDPNGNTILQLGNDFLNNLLIGINAGSALTYGQNNTGLGNNTFATLTEGQNNTAAGNYALNAVTLGSDNVAMGAYAGTAITTGIENVAVGNNALQLCEDGNQNVAVGNSAGGAITSGLQNICIGYATGGTITTGDANIMIGNGSSISSPTANAEVAIGQWLRGAGQFSNSGWHFNGGTPTRPNIDLTPTAQEIVDALVALGLVTQS